MIDLHTHSVFSDGELIPSEMARRMAEIGNEGFAITDHGDFSNIPSIMGKLNKMKEVRDDYELKILFGIEITHVPPKMIGKAVELALKEGAEIIVVHGETIVEPVKGGTNFHALQEEIDILAHPGLIDESSAELAHENKVYLEISSRKGHSLTNGYVAKMSKKFGCEVVLNTDSHSPTDFINTDIAEKIALGSGIENVKSMFENSRKLLERKFKKI